MSKATLARWVVCSAVVIALTPANTGRALPSAPSPEVASAIAAVGANDAFAQAVSVATGSTTTVDNTGATGEPGERGGSGELNTMWFKWTAPADGILTVDLHANWNTYVCVHSGGAVGSTTVVLCNDNTYTDSSSLVQAPVVSGITYRIQIDGSASVQGVVTMLVTFGAGQKIPPSEPTGLTATKDDLARTATVQWSPPLSTGRSPITGYWLRLRAPYTNDPDVWVTLSASARSYTASNLTNGQYYAFSVGAINAIGNGPADFADVTLNAVSTEPTAFTLTKNDAERSATMTWAPPSWDGGAPVTGYRVSRTAFGTHPAWSTTLPADARSQTMLNLRAGGTYTLSVAAINAVGTGPVSSGTVTINGATVPGAPVVGTATAGAAGGAITATAAWTPPASTGGSPITGYVVRALRMSATNTVLSTTTSAVQGASKRSLSMTLPQAGNYRFTVQAINSVGPGALSARSNQVAGR